MHQFTDQQISDFISYEKARSVFNYNMFAPQAREMAGLSDEAFLFVTNNAKELEKERDDYDLQHED